LGESAKILNVIQVISRVHTRDKIKIWFSDEARIGQKNKITRRWAKRGNRS
jgi:putative transposase